MKYDSLILERTKEIIFNSIKDDIEMQLVDIQDGDDRIGFVMNYYIRCFGVTERGESISIKITKFQPYFFIKCPKNWRHSDGIDSDTGEFRDELENMEHIRIDLRKAKQYKLRSKPISLEKYLTKHNIELKDFNKRDYFSNDCEFNNFGNLYQTFVDNSIVIILMGNRKYRSIGVISNHNTFLMNDTIKESKRLGKYWINQMKCDLVKYKSFDGYKTKDIENNYLRLTFDSKSAFNKIKQVLTYNKFSILKNKKFKMYEANIPPILRLFHDKDIKPASWIKLQKTKYIGLGKVDKETNCQYECEIEFDDVEPFEKDKIAPLIIASFDLECTSGDGGFPQFRRESDKIIQIGTTVNKYGIDEKDFRQNVIFTLKGCDDINDAYVKSFDTEKELIQAWADYIVRLDPDMITGYNIFGFDFEYLYERALILFGKDSDINYSPESINPLLMMSRLRKKSQYKVKRLQSSALGQNSLKYIKMPGRIIFDVMKYVQREFKLQLYKLDFVAQKYLAGMKKDDVSPKQIFAFQEKDDKHRRIIAEYCLQDCWLCNKLAMKFCIIENTVGMANTCLVPMDFIFMRGQGIKAQSLVAKECRKLGYVLPTLTEKRPGTYKGAIVLTANAGYHFKPVSCLDYSSLYPSCMISHNLCISSLVSPDTNKKLFDKLNKLSENPLNLITNEERKDYFLIDGKNKYRILEWDNDPGTIPEHEKYFYIQPDMDEKGKAFNDEDRGVLPKILMKLLAQRAATRKQQKLEKDPFKKSIMNGLQLSYKITANSIYGQLGAPTSSFSMPCVAASVTAIGRSLLEIASTQCEKMFPDGTTTIYGDTDSVFMSFGLNGLDPMSEEALKLSIEMAQKADKYISDNYLTYPHRLEYEKTYQPYILFSKKRYVGKKYEFKTGKDDWDLDYKGIELKRRDNAKILKKIYKGCLDSLLNGNTEESFKYLQSCLNNLINNHTKKEYEINDFILTKTLKPIASYKTGCKNRFCKIKTYYGKKTCDSCDSELDMPSQGHVILAERVRKRDPGNAYQSNDRVPYVFISTKKDRKKILQGERIETPNYIEDKKLKIDYGYYIDQIENSILQLYGKQKDKKGKEIPLNPGDVKNNLDKVKKIFQKSKIKAENKRTGVKEIGFYFKKLKVSQ